MISPWNRLQSHLTLYRRWWKTGCSSSLQQYQGRAPHLHGFYQFMHRTFSLWDTVLTASDLNLKPSNYPLFLFYAHLVSCIYKIYFLKFSHGLNLSQCAFSFTHTHSLVHIYTFIALLPPEGEAKWFLGASPRYLVHTDVLGQVEYLDFVLKDRKTLQLQMHCWE